jgi:type II secretory pathway component PulM
MNRILLIAGITLVAATAFSVPAQPPQTDEKREQLEVLGKEVRAQQAAIAANQAKIDEKIAALAETVRTARIFASRGGR